MQPLPTEVTPDVALQRLDGMIRSKDTWLREHGSSRPEWEVGLYRLDREVLVKVRQWFANGLEKKRQMEST